MNIKEFYSICKTEKNLKGYIWQNNYDQFEKKPFSNENLLNFYFGNGNWEVNINQSDLENYKSFLLNFENLNQKDSIIKSLDIFVCKYFNERDYREYISYYINENNFSNLSVRKIINKFILFNSRFILIILRRILKKFLNLK